jgi:hypothetical protein
MSDDITLDEATGPISAAEAGGDPRTPAEDSTRTTGN